MIVRIAILVLLFAAPAQADVTSWRVGTTENDVSGHYSNDTAHDTSDVADGNDPPQTGRVEGFNVGVFMIQGFGFTTGDVPTGSTINQISINMEFHGGMASQAVRRRINVDVVDETGTACGTGISAVQAQLGEEEPAGAASVITLDEDDNGSFTWTCGTWAATDIHDVDFGMQWNHTSAAGSNIIGIDYVEMQIDYTPPATGRRMMIIGAKTLGKILRWFGFEEEEEYVYASNERSEQGTEDDHQGWWDRDLHHLDHQSVLPWY
jgi:hypothetical protein